MMNIKWTRARAGLPKKNGRYLCHISNNTLMACNFTVDSRTWEGTTEFKTVLRWAPIPKRLLERIDGNMEGE